MLEVFVTVEHGQDGACAHQDLLVIVFSIFLETENPVDHFLLDYKKTNFRSFENCLYHLQLHDNRINGFGRSYDMMHVEIDLLCFPNIYEYRRAAHHSE